MVDLLHRDDDIGLALADEVDRPASPEVVGLDHSCTAGLGTADVAACLDLGCRHRMANRMVGKWDWLAKWMDLWVLLR